MASDDRPADRPRFTLRRFFTPDDEPAESAPAGEPVSEPGSEAFGTGDVDDEALDAIVESALVWGSDEVPPPVPGAVIPPAQTPGAEDPFGAQHASVDEFTNGPVGAPEPVSAETAEDPPLSFESAVLEEEPEDLSRLDAVADAIDVEALDDPFESPTTWLDPPVDLSETEGMSDAASAVPDVGFIQGSPRLDEATGGIESDGAEREAAFWEMPELDAPASEAQTAGAQAAGASDEDPLDPATDSFGLPAAEAESAAESPSTDPATGGLGWDETGAGEAEGSAADPVRTEVVVADAEDAEPVVAEGFEADAEGVHAEAVEAGADPNAVGAEEAVADSVTGETAESEADPTLGAEPAVVVGIREDVEADASAAVVPEPVEAAAEPVDVVFEPVEEGAEAAEVDPESVPEDADAVEVDSVPVDVASDAELVDAEPAVADPTDAIEADARWLEASALAAVAAAGGLAHAEPTPSDPEPIPMESAEIATELTTADTTAAVDEAFESQSDPAKAGAVAADGIEGDLEVQPLGPEDFAPGELRGVLRTMMLSRKLDEKMLTLLKQGKGFFHIGSAGHEASQIAVARQFEGGHDWFCCYYRDLATTLTVGLTPSEVLRAHYGKAADVFGGGRQMPEHFGHRGLNILSTSSSVGAQYVPAVGFALAVQREDGDAEASRAVYASGGEGSTSQGAFHEALNWAAREALPVLFHIQDNKFAISVPVEEQTAGGSIWHLLGGYAGLRRLRYDGTDFFESAAAAKAAMAHIRAGHGPVALHADLVRLLPHSSSDDHKKYRAAESLEADAARDPIPRLAGQLVQAGVMTADEVDALRAEVAAEIDALAKAIEKEADPDPATATAHVYYEGPDSRVYEQPGEAGDLIVMVDAINHALDEEMTRDPKVLVYGEDVGGGKGGVFTATRGLSAKHGRDRCFNSPLAEHSVIGSAVGLACAGYKPVVEIQFADYIWPGMQPLRNQVASMRYRSNNAWACPMVIRVPAGGYIHGGLCHSQNIEALFGHFPGLHVVMPSNAADAKGLLKSAIRGEDPVLFLEHKALYRQGPARRPEPHDEYLVPLGKAAVAREGTDLTIVTWGAIVYKALATAKVLEKEGVSVEVIDVRSILPFDAETVLASVRKTGRVLVAYEDHEFMGFGAEIAAQVADSAFGSLDAPVKRVAGAFSSVPYADALEKAVLPQDADILRAAREVLAY